MNIRPALKILVISKRFAKDLKDEKQIESIADAVLDCSSVDFYELHKFEKTVNGNLVFRAKANGIHVVYCVDREMRLILLRAFKNYAEYKRFLDDEKEIDRTIKNAAPTHH